jgi:uncharacterized paraquat-inducible protein A
MNWLKNFMAGRYGGDQLSMALLILSIILTLVARLAQFPILGFFSYIPIGIVLFRMFSRNISKRSMENYKFFMVLSPVYEWLKKFQNNRKDAKTHKRYKCPTCNIQLRVPRGKGKIIITCPKCKTQFTKKT